MLYILADIFTYLRNSQESSNAVKIGSLEERAIKDGEARARYAFILDLECRSESSILEVTHSSQPHLQIEILKIITFSKTRLLYYRKG